MNVSVIARAERGIQCGDLLEEAGLLGFGGVGVGGDDVCLGVVGAQIVQQRLRTQQRVLHLEVREAVRAIARSVGGARRVQTLSALGGVAGSP